MDAKTKGKSETQKKNHRMKFNLKIRLTKVPTQKLDINKTKKNY